MRLPILAPHRSKVDGYKVVEQKSSILAIPGEDPVPLYEDHRSMCRFADETESYRAVSQAIRRIATAIKDKGKAGEEHSDERSSVHSSVRSKTWNPAVTAAGSIMILTLR
jgi:hypothetical protein